MATAPALPFRPGPEDGKLLKRSRTGCLTCRSRRKKCSEEYDEDGTCTRCRKGGWKCVRPGESASESSSKKGKVARPRREDPPLMSSSQEASLNDGLPPCASPPAAASGGSSDVFASTSRVAASSFLGQPPPVFASPAPYAAFAPPATETPSFAHFPDASSLFPPVFPPFLPPSTVFPAPAEPLLQTANLDALLNYDSAGGNELDLDLEAFLAQLAHQADPVPVSQPTQPSIVESDAHVPRSPIPVANQTEALLLQFYETNFATAWTVSYTPLARERQVAKCKELITYSPTARLAAKFAAAAYIKLYRATSLGGAYAPVAGSPHADLPPEYSQVDINLMPLLDKAMQLATRSDSVETLEARLWAISDLHAGLGALDLPAKSYQIVSLADSLLSRAFGPASFISWSAVHGVSSWPVYAFVLINLMRSIRRRTPTFLKLNEQEAEKAHCAGHKNWFGQPPSLTALLIRVSDLCAAVHTSRHPSSPYSFSTHAIDSAYEHEALAIMKRLEDWRPSYSVYDSGRDRHSVALAGEMTVGQETWRSLGLLLLHRLVLGRTSDHRVVAPLLSKLMSNLKAVAVLSRIRREMELHFLDWWTSSYTTPAFIVGSMVTGSDRTFVRSFILSSGREPTFSTMVKVLEETWRRTDETGVTADWWEVAADMGADWPFV
ncbi:hypothetical protein JCM8097_006137 [Rhodosporidiobolus ruineniae]